MWRALFVVSACVFALSWSGLARAHADGTKIAGNCGIDPTKTCNACHSGGTVSQITFLGPAQLAPGAVGDYQVVIANSAPKARYAGVDIGTDNPKAALDAAGGTDTLVGNEVVHNTPVPFVNGEVAFSFKLTAPTTPGTVTVYADGMAGDLLDVPAGTLATVGSMKVTVGTGGAADAGGGSKAGGCSASPGAAGLGGLPLLGLALGLVAARRRRRTGVHAP